jgi:hypothetical protein
MSSRRPRTLLPLLLFLCAVAATRAAAATKYVDVANTTGIENGTQAHPYRSIQAGINSTTTSGDRVLVTAGTYMEGIIMRDGVDVECAAPPACIIDATGRNRSVVVFNNTKLYPKIDGFTIRGGTGDRASTTEDGLGVYLGGGVRIVGAAIVTNNIIENNVLTNGLCHGGGIDVTPQSEEPQIVGNVIRNNSALCPAYPAESNGGGIHVSQKFSKTLITDNFIEGNVAHIGGGIYARNQADAQSFILRNVLQFNEASEGAGIFTADDFDSTTTIASNVLYGNETPAGVKDCNDADPTVGPGLPELCNDAKDNDCNPATPDVFDADHDGFMCNVDCADNNPARKPGVSEQCTDGVDNNCDGLVDAADTASCGCGDPDGDGYSCTDCNNSNAQINPGRPEICNDGLNNDCNAATPDLTDADGDTYNCAIDCNEADPAIHPNVPEITCDGIDNDCNPGTPDEVDADNDLWRCPADCNDNNFLINPNGFENCFDGIDNDCNGFIDTADFECSCPNPSDSDGDGFRCQDCNDQNASIKPSANEICNDGINNDCSSSTPDIFDGDKDGFNCTQECRDFDPHVFPGAPEHCSNGLDDDCDGATDGADTDCACGDPDGDGYSCDDCNNSNPAVRPGRDEVCNDGINNDCNAATPDVGDADGDGVNCLTDCDDHNAAIKPGAAEICADFLDNDCDNLIDVLRPDLVLADFGSAIDYKANAVDPGIGLNWTQEVFDDSTWTKGLFGIGYEIGGGGVNDLVVTEVPQTSRSVYTRLEFEIGDVAGVQQVWFGADYDDAYVVWINGVEVRRSPEMPAGTPLWNANPALHESSNGQVPNYGTLINISAVAIPALHDGTNLLAIGLYNDIPNLGGNSSDLVIVPRLSMRYGSNDPDCACPDADGDGFACDDCDDTREAVHPGATEIGCNSIDDDCNPATGDGTVDADGDGFNCSNDCDDTFPEIRPGAPEVGCNGFDDDCNFETSDTLDLDGDMVDCILDCNDADPNISPDRLEVPCDNIDNDCNTLTPDKVDGDLDGYRCDLECNDNNAAIHPGVVETCNDGVDNNCDGAVDLADSQCACADADGDGYRCGDCNDANAQINPGRPEVCNDGINNDCNAATADVSDADGDGVNCITDCNDSNPFVKPGLPELCGDGVNNDCNGATPDVYDTDGDGFNCSLDCRDDIPAINPGVAEVCSDGVDNDCNQNTPDLFDGDGDGHACAFDCNDASAAVHPGAAEACNDGIDNDCDPTTPDVFDGDQDGASCIVDCADNQPLARPGLPEQCSDGIDNDCDNQVDAADSGCAGADADHDGYAVGLDCNDANPNVNPGVPEVCGDGINNDCNAATPDVADLDGDGFICTSDCNDHDPAIHPGVPEICGDGKNNDCNAATPDLGDGDADTYACNVDCNDANSAVHPGATEVTCDGVDNDCSVFTVDLGDRDNDNRTCADLEIRGGGISTRVAINGTARIVNNTVVLNTTPGGTGGGLWLDGIDASVPSTVANNVFVDNTAFVGGGIDHTLFGGEILHNNFFSNDGGDLYNGGASTALKSANTTVNPSFESVTYGNFHLKAQSPLIDAADPTYAPATDVDGYTRPFDGDGDAVPVADLGAYEYPSGEVFNTRFVTKTNLTWNVRAGEQYFNVYRGELIVLQSLGQYTQDPARVVGERFCGVRSNQLPFVDTLLPAAGRVHIYMVTLTDSRRAYEGSLGQNSFGALRFSHFPCPE